MFRDLMIFNELRGISEGINDFGNVYGSQIIEAIEKLEPQPGSFGDSFWPYVISFIVGSLTTIASTWFVEKAKLYRDKNEELEGFKDSLKTLASAIKALKFLEENLTYVDYPEEVDLKTVIIDAKSITFDNVEIVEKLIDDLITKGLILNFDLYHLMTVKSYIANLRDGVQLIIKQQGELTIKTFNKIQKLIDDSVENINRETIKLDGKTEKNFFKFLFKK